MQKVLQNFRKFSKLSTSVISKQQKVISLQTCTPSYNLLQNTKRTRVKSKVLEFEVPHIEKDVFLTEANYLLYQLETAFEKLKSEEDKILEVTLEETEDKQNVSLKVKTSDVGEYKWHTESKDRLLFFFSPHSGVFKYYFDEANEQWISNKDKHLHMEHLVREITWNYRGLLEI